MQVDVTVSIEVGEELRIFKNDGTVSRLFHFKKVNIGVG